jgi:hypothetical protein
MLSSWSLAATDARNPDLVVNSENNAGLLFAIAQCAVAEPDLRRKCK